MNASLQTLLQRLPELDASLRAADFTVSPDRWQSVYDLVYRLEREHRLPKDPQALAALIAPLFCNNKTEQQTFYPLFRQWAGGDLESADEPIEVLHHSTLARNQQQAYERQTRKRPLWSFVIVFLLLAALLAWYNSKPQSQTSTPPANATQTLQIIAGREIEITPQPAPEVDPRPARDLQPIPPRQPPEVVHLDAQGRSDMRFLRDLLLSLPLVFLLAWLFRRWSRRQALQRFHRGLYANPLMYLKLRRNNRTLPFGWGEFSQRLKRSGNIETRKLDIERTIDKTIHHAGLFTPVRLKRERQPAYLVLMNRANSQDHLADRANSLFDRLKEANVTVYRFEYHQDPRLCFSTGQSRKAHTLNQLARHYAGCRLILIGDGEALIDPFSGEAQRWVRQFEAWNTRVLLTPAPQPWDAREAQIAHAGFAVAPFRVNGLEAVSDWLLKPSLDAVWFQPGNEDPLPELFALDESVWLSGTPPPDYDAGATCAVLVDYLGQSGYRLLTACAAYPQLVSELTLTLDQILFPADNGAAREKRLVRLTRLPWFREGHLPEYLRRDLLERAGEAQVERFGDAYIGIFKSVTSNLFARAANTMVGWMTNRITLFVIGVLVLSALVWFRGPYIKFGDRYAGLLEGADNRLIVIMVCAGLWGFALWLKGKLSKQKTKRKQKHDGSREYIRDLVRFAPHGSPMADRMFADVILRGQRDLLDAVLPGQLVKRLPGHRYRLWPVVLASLLSAMLVTGLHFSWSWAAPMLEEEMVQQMKVENAAITVQISIHEDTLALGDALQASLTEWGFKVAPRQYAKPSGDEARLDQEQRNRIISAELTPEQLSPAIVQAATSLRPALDMQFKSFQQQYDDFNSNKVIESITSQGASALQARLIQDLSSADIELNNRRQLDALMQNAITEWVNGLDSAIRRMAAARLISSNKAEQVIKSDKLSEKLKGSIKRTIPESTDVESLIQTINQIIRNQLPGQLTNNMGDVSARIARQYQAALDEKLRLAGEAQRNNPDAIVYRDGYQNAAQTVRQRLAYLSYGGEEYPLLPDQDIVLKAGENPVQVSVNLSQSVSAGGVFRDRIKEQPAQAKPAPPKPEPKVEPPTRPDCDLKNYADFSYWDALELFNTAGCFRVDANNSQLAQRVQAMLNANADDQSQRTLRALTLIEDELDLQEGDNAGALKRAITILKQDISDQPAAPLEILKRSWVPGNRLDRLPDALDQMNLDINLRAERCSLVSNGNCDTEYVAASDLVRAIYLVNAVIDKFIERGNTQGQTGIEQQQQQQAAAKLITENKNKPVAGNFQSEGPGFTLGKPSQKLLDKTGYTLERCLDECYWGVHGACVAATFHRNNECKLFQSYTGIVKSNVADKMVYIRTQKPATLIEPEMVIITAGTFVMGSPQSEKGSLSSEGPQHEVSIRSFALGRTEVTFDEYDRFADAIGRKRPNDQGWGRGSRPVINVSWNDATAYAEWLSEQTGKRYRLPSEAEWEYAVRAGSTSRFHFGVDEAELCNYANFRDKSYDPKSTRCDDGVNRQTAAVGGYQPNRFGLLDMHGNVWEWTQDCWHGNYEGAPGDGSAWLEADNGECARRVFRGGGWYDLPEFLRSAYRSRDSTDGADYNRGFRLARAL